MSIMQILKSLLFSSQKKDTNHEKKAKRIEWLRKQIQLMSIQKNQSSALKNSLIKYKQELEQLQSKKNIKTTPAINNATNKQVNHRTYQSPEIETNSTKSSTIANQDTINVAIVDTETTGLDHDDEPISIGLVLFEVDATTGQKICLLNQYYGLREPSVKINKHAELVHGISINSLIGLNFDDAKILSIFNQSELIIAHNASFDKKMLVKIYPELRKKTWLCTYKNLSTFWKKYPNAKLDTICSNLNITRTSPHNALDDCIALSEVVFSRQKATQSTTYLKHLINLAKE